MNPQDPLDQALTRALETAPTFDIPGDFAARVLARLPVTRSSRIPLPAYLPTLPSLGRRIALASAGLLFLAMLALALTPAAPFVRTATEATCIAEFILLTAWLSLRPQKS